MADGQEASVRPSSLARACAPRSAPGDKEPSVWLTEGVVRPDLCQHRLRTVPGPRCQSSQTEQLARPGLTMGTLGCDPATRLATVPLAQRVAEGHIPETGLRKSCGMATLENGSGPGLYVLPSTVGYVNHDCTKTASPAYSLARRPSQAPLQDTSPGPVYFLDPKVTRFGRVCPPAYSIQGRGKSRDLEVTPGPGAYSPEKVPPAGQRNPPAFTLGFRLRPKPLDTSAPAPNAYTMPPLWGSQVFVKPSSPSFTVGGRTPPVRPPQDPAEIPGPGQYDSPDPNTYRLRRPAFTMLGRPRAPRPLEETPGPGTHSPEQVTLNRARAPAYTMGIRHSKRAATLAADMTP